MDDLLYQIVVALAIAGTACIVIAVLLCLAIFLLK